MITDVSLFALTLPLYNIRKSAEWQKQWTHEKVDKVSNETTNKVYAEYKQGKLNENGQKARKALDKQIISLHSTRISQVVKIKDVKELQQDIQNGSIIRD